MTRSQGLFPMTLLEFLVDVLPRACTKGCHRLLASWGVRTARMCAYALCVL